MGGCEEWRGQWKHMHCRGVRGEAGGALGNSNPPIRPKDTGQRRHLSFLRRPTRPAIRGNACVGEIRQQAHPGGLTPGGPGQRHAHLSPTRPKTPGCDLLRKDQDGGALA